MKTIPAVLTAAAALAVAVPAQAQDVKSVHVATRDLDLTSAHGQRMLTLRLTRAASQVCDAVNERFDVNVRVAQRQCRQAAISTALASVGLKTRLALR